MDKNVIIVCYCGKRIKISDQTLVETIKDNKTILSCSFCGKKIGK